MSVCVSQWASERASKYWVNEKMNEWMNEWMNERMTTVLANHRSQAQGPEEFRVNK